MINMISELAIPDRTLFMNSIHSFFGIICKFMYRFFSGAIDLMYDLAKFDFGLNDYINDISSRIFGVLTIFMIFKLTLSIMTYLINPDNAIDSNKGFQNIIKRVIISIVILISINPIFEILKDVQNSILDEKVLTSILASSDEKEVIRIADENIELHSISMSSYCPEDKKIWTVSEGDRLGMLLFRPFLQPYDKNEILDEEGLHNSWNAVFGEDSDKDMSYYCGTKLPENFQFVLDNDSKNLKQNIKSSIDGPNGADGLLLDMYYNLAIHEADSGSFANGDGTTGKYFFEFNFIIALISVVVALLIIISFCFDVVIRSLNIIILKLIAPIPIISYISPEGKSSEMLKNWGSKLIGTWVSLFIRIIILDLGILIIGTACDAIFNNLKTSNASLMMQVFIILGTLMFMKKLPQLIEELIPGLKFGGLELNPFKRIQNEALGGRYINGALGAASNAVTSGISQTASNMAAFARNRTNLKKDIATARKKGDFAKANRLQNRLDNMNWIRGAKTFAGGITGGARRGLVSGFSSGTSGRMDILRNTRSNVQSGNRVRNNRSAIRGFNQDVIYEANEKIKQAGLDLIAGRIDQTTHDSIVEQAKIEANEQRYTWFERNITERIDQAAGVKNTNGGYGMYNDKIEDLTKKIDNLHSTEMAMRTALANKTQYFGQLEDIRTEIEGGANLTTAINSVIQKYGMSSSDFAILQHEYHINKTSLDGITNLDDQQKQLKAERKSYQEMTEARDALKNDK